MKKRVYNFYAGPATLPLPALKKAQKDLLNFRDTGMSLMEISHRSKAYAEVHAETSNLVRKLMKVPNDYKILWLQGGASTQFYMVPLNLQINGKPFEYVNTGAWSKKAIKEGKFYGNVNEVASSEDENFSYIPKNINVTAFNKKVYLIHVEGRVSKRPGHAFVDLCNNDPGVLHRGLDDVNTDTQRDESMLVGWRYAYQCCVYFYSSEFNKAWYVRERDGCVIRSSLLHGVPYRRADEE